MLQNAADPNPFIDVLREIFVRFDWVGIALSFQRVTLTALYHATSNALYRCRT